MKQIFFALAILSVIFYANSCKKDSASALAQYTDAVTCNEADDTLNTYNQKIKTILNNNCATGGCHDAATHERNKDYSTYSGAKAGMDATGYCAINQKSGCSAMPQGAAKLSSADIHDLTCWAKNSYPQ